MVISTSYRSVDRRDVAPRAVSRVVHDKARLLSFARLRSSATALHARAMIPSHLQLPSSIVVSGSISPPSFLTATIAAMRGRTCADGGGCIACDRNVRGGVLALAALADRRRFHSKPAADGV